MIWRSSERVMRANVVYATPAGVDAKAALADPDVVTLLLLQRSASQNRVRNLRRLLEPTADLKHMLQEELGVR